MTPIDEARNILKSAYALIDTPEKHCIGELALDKEGLSCEPVSDKAIRWCAVGALHAAIGVDYTALPPGQIRRYRPTLPKALAFEALAEAAHDLYKKGISQINDELGHAAVLNVYNLAVTLR